MAGSRAARIDRRDSSERAPVAGHEDLLLLLHNLVKRGEGISEFSYRHRAHSPPWLAIFLCATYCIASTQLSEDGATRAFRSWYIASQYLLPWLRRADRRIMKRTFLFLPLLVVALTVVFLLGIGVTGASAAAVTRYQQNASQFSYFGHLDRLVGHRGLGRQFPLRERIRHLGHGDLQRHVSCLDRQEVRILRHRPGHARRDEDLLRGSLQQKRGVSGEGLGNGHS